MATTTSQTFDLGYVSLVSPEHGLSKLGTKELSEVLIPGPISHILVHIDYCLGRPTKFKLRPNDKALGLTREEIIRGIVSMYTHVYKAEVETMPEPSAYEHNKQPGRKVFSLNRGQTTGKYCIHLHELGDLFLHSATYDSATRHMYLGLDS